MAEAASAGCRPGAPSLRDPRPLRRVGGRRERVALTVVEIHRSPWRAAGLFAAACGFVAACVRLLSDDPGAGLRTVAPGSFTGGAACLGIGVFGLCAARVLRTLFQRGPVVSVGPGGIFDRRLSTDWIPWTAIRGITTVQIRRQRLIALEVDPRIAASLPWTKRARRVARLNRILGDHRYWIASIDLRGGFTTLSDAVARGWSGRNAWVASDGRICDGSGGPVDCRPASAPLKPSSARGLAGTCGS
ncbi:STM3941 family protein [Methylobacterium oryzae CBMB20]